MHAGAHSWAYSLNGFHWPDGTQIGMHLGLSRTQVPLQDGFATWNDSAADALAIWNSYVPKVAFVATDATTPAPQDGVNSVAFASDVYGDAWGTNVLAVTLYFHNGSIFSEADVLFNTRYNWNSYRGPLEHSGTTTTYDFHRVALHEFGHVLGLSHPDEHGQSVDAIMNSMISDLDHLVDDDIAGARSLYGFKITSNLFQQQATSGNQFTYQIKADNQPTSYSASGLPPELQVNPSTGLISGRCYTTGTFQVTIEADDPRGPAIGKFTLFVSPQPITSTSSPSSIVIGSSFSYRITAANNPTSFTATNLPAGLSLDPNTGLISGTPTVTGNFAVTVTAVGPTAIAGSTITISILPPQITSARSVPNLELGDPFSYQITATNNPSSFSATGLPPGFQVDTATGLITGTATKSGFYSITLKAQTAFGEASASLSINILPARITSASSAAVTIGASFRFQITASNHPTSFEAQNLPAGLQVDGASGLISGVPTLSGTYSVKLVAHGSPVDAAGNLNVTVSPAANFSPSNGEIVPTGFTLMVADPSRPRLYTNGTSGILIYDYNPLGLVKLLPLSIVSPGFEISADGRKLYVSGGVQQVIKLIDLETLQYLPDIPVSGHWPINIKAGADGALYITDANHYGIVYQIDPETGNTLNQFTPTPPSGTAPLILSLTPDRKTLFVHQPQTISKYNLSAGGAPALLQQITPGTNNTFTRFAVAPDGQNAGVIVNSSSSSMTTLRSIADLNVVVATLPASGKPIEIEFSPNNAFAVQTNQSSSVVDVIDVQARRIVKSISLPFTDEVPPLSFNAPNIIFANDSSRVSIASAAGRIWIYGLPLPSPPKTLLNVSTRLHALTGDEVPIGGFIIEGSKPKKVIVRAIGPSLTKFGVSGAMADPVIELHNSAGAVVGSNDNWNEHRSDVLNTDYPPSDEHEAAMVTTLDPGAYTAIVRGVNDTTGVALVEVFDLDPLSGSRVSNISTRGKVETGDNVMIGGFIIGGDQPTKVIVRAIGPSLAQYGVPGTLADPMLTLYDSNGTAIASNDDWQSDQPEEISDSGKAPADAHESALLRTLAPGAYTAIVSGKDGSTGVALVEIYNLESSTN